MNGLKEIQEWRQGPLNCTGVSFSSFWDPQKGEHCLGSAVTWNGKKSSWDTILLEPVAEIIDRLFPERACRCGRDANLRVIHFNNHPETTKDQVNKILHTYYMENN